MKRDNVARHINFLNHTVKASTVCICFGNGSSVAPLFLYILQYCFILVDNRSSPLTGQIIDITANILQNSCKLNPDDFPFGLCVLLIFRMNAASLGCHTHSFHLAACRVQ